MEHFYKNKIDDLIWIACTELEYNQKKNEGCLVMIEDSFWETETTIRNTYEFSMYIPMRLPKQKKNANQSKG